MVFVFLCKIDDTCECNREQSHESSTWLMYSM